MKRISKDRIIAGVCSGLAQSTGIDALLWRIGFIISFLFFGFGPLVYLLLWILTPSE